MADLTCDPSDPRLGHGSDEKPVPQNKAYLVDCDVTKKFVRPVRQAYIHKTCGSITTMSAPLAETYAKDPKFYGSTYCVSCRMHRPVSEFIWDDGSKEQVGS